MEEKNIGNATITITPIIEEEALQELVQKVRDAVNEGLKLGISDLDGKHETA